MPAKTVTYNLRLANADKILQAIKELEEALNNIRATINTMKIVVEREE